MIKQKHQYTNLEKLQETYSLVRMNAWERRTKKSGTFSGARGGGGVNSNTRPLNFSPKSTTFYFRLQPILWLKMEENI